MKFMKIIIIADDYFNIMVFVLALDWVFPRTSSTGTFNI